MRIDNLQLSNYKQFLSKSKDHFFSPNRVQKWYFQRIVSNCKIIKMVFVF